MMYQSQKRSDNKKPQFIAPSAAGGRNAQQQQRPQSNKGALNRTTQDGANNVSGLLSGGAGDAQQNNRSFNAPLMMRHASPNQQQQKFLSVQRQAQHQQAARHQQTAAQPGNNSSRGPTPQGKQPNGNNQQSQQQQQQKQHQRQYQPSLMFKPGQAKQQFQHLAHGRSEPEIVANSYHTEPVQQQLHPVPMSYPGGGAPATTAQQQHLQPASIIRRSGPQAQQQLQQQQQLLQPNYVPQFNSNQSSYQTQKGRQQFEGPQAAGAENQHPFPRQFPANKRPPPTAQGGLQQHQHQQKFASPDSHQTNQQVRRSSEGLKNAQARSPPIESRQTKKLPTSTHQMKAYETAPSGQPNFYPPQQQLPQMVMPATGLEDGEGMIVGEDNSAAAIGAAAGRGNRQQYLDMPRTSADPEAIVDYGVLGDGEDDQQIREMENLLAEIGQDVSELKKRPFYKSKIQSSEPRSSSRKAYQQNSKTSSLSPKNQSRSRRSYHSGSQEGTSHMGALQHRSLSPQIGNGSNTAGPRKQASSQSRKHLTSQNASQAQQPAAADSVSDSQQWASPNERQRFQSQAPQIPNPTPSHTNTMSLTVSVNPDHNGQERLFRLSPLSSKMQEDTDGDEQSTSQRFFNLNQSINNSQLDSSSPDNHHNLQSNGNNNLNQRRSSRRAMAAAESGHANAAGNSNAARTYEDADDDEEVQRIVAHIEDGQNSQRQLVQQPYSEDQPVLRSSALGRSQTAVRTDTPLATSDIRNEQATTRAFSRSSNRRGRSTDTGLQYEGPARAVQTKSSQCQTDEQLAAEKGEGSPQKKRAEMAEQGTQTARRDFAPIQLSPFDTYDLFFVKDLVNNLNQDNEVLVDSNQDLKYAFHYLLQKHKQLQQQLSREHAKIALFDDTKKRLAEVTTERDKAIEHGMQLSQKVLTMNRIVRLAVDEQAHLEQEAELVMSQLQEENTMLRGLLKISQEYSAPTTQANLTKTIQEIEQKQAEMAYQSDLKLREQIKGECEREFEMMKKELPEKIERELQQKFEIETKELKSEYEDKIAKHEEETALLKKTLLEQSLQRLNVIQSQQPHHQTSSLGDGSEESNSLEGSHGLHHFSNNSSERPPSTGEQLQMSGSFSSAKDNSQSEVMQQELDDFAKIYHGELTQEEQELVSQLQAQANQNKHQTEVNELRDSQKLQTRQREAHNPTPTTDPTQLSPDTAIDRMAEDDDLDDEMEDDDLGDDYADDFEQFGEEAKSPTDDDQKLVKVVTNPKAQPAQEQQQLMSQPDREWDFDQDGNSENLFSSKATAPKEQIESSPPQMDAQTQPQKLPKPQVTVPDSFNDNDAMDEDSSPLMMQSKMGAETSSPQAPENVDLLADFGNDELDGRDEVQETGEQAELLRQQYDDFFTSESDEIEDELIDGQSSDSDSDHGGNISPKSFDELIERQKQQNKALSPKDLEDGDEEDKEDKEGLFTGFLSQDQTQQQQQPQSSSTESPGTIGTSSKQPEDEGSSERRNKYKRVKRDSAGPQDSQTTPPDNLAKQQEQQNNAKTTSFTEMESSNALDEPIEFNPPQEASTAAIAQDFEDFLYSESSGQGSELIASGGLGNSLQSSAGAKDNNLFDADFYDEWDEDGDDLFGSGAGAVRCSSGVQGKISGGNRGGEGMDEEDRRFFEELSKGFSASRDSAEDKAMERNELMDDTRATRSMLAAQRQHEQQQLEQHNAEGGSVGVGTGIMEDDLGAIDFAEEREEAKEDEYDYFLDNQPEENGGNAQGYHIIDEADLQESDEDLEELTEEEQEQRHREMLKEFKERIDREDAKASRSPRHKPASRSPRHKPRGM